MGDHVQVIKGKEGHSINYQFLRELIFFHVCASRLTLVRCIASGTSLPLCL
jgi:hypothetical protein